MRTSDSVALASGTMPSPPAIPPAIDEAVLWIYEHLRFQLHPKPDIHNALWAMHEDYPFRTLFESWCEELPNLRFTSIPGGRLKGGAQLIVLQDALRRSADAGYWKALSRHLLGLKLLKVDSAERALLTLFEATIPRRLDDPKGAHWYEEFLTWDLSLNRGQVREFFAHPASHQRALECIVLITLLRYAQHGHPHPRLGSAVQSSGSGAGRGAKRDRDDKGERSPSLWNGTRAKEREGLVADGP